MAREILFRGFCPNESGDETIILDEEEIMGDWHYWNCFDGINRLNAGFMVADTVGQWTGLTDKNGKKIFEGDIVTGLFNYTNIIGHIVYGSDATFFIERKGLYGIGLNNAEDWLEVIGNIHRRKRNIRHY